MNESPSLQTERRWLAEGVQRGLIREEMGARIFKALAESVHEATVENNEPVFPTAATLNLWEAEAEKGYVLAAEASVDYKGPDGECPEFATD